MAITIESAFSWSQLQSLFEYWFLIEALPSYDGDILLLADPGNKFITLQFPASSLAETRVQNPYWRICCKENGLDGTKLSRRHAVAIECVADGRMSPSGTNEVADTKRVAKKGSHCIAHLALWSFVAYFSYCNSGSVYNKTTETLFCEAIFERRFWRLYWVMQQNFLNVHT